MRLPFGARRGSWPAAVRLVLFAALTLSAAPWPAAGAPPAIEAEAGLGGVSRPGRWTPVRVILQTAGEDLDGDLVVEWGESVVRRAVTLPAPSSKEFDLYIRASDPSGSVLVRFHPAAGSDAASVELPVRAARVDDTVTVCVTSAPASLIPEECTAILSPGSLPRSPRGYDAADRVVWPSGEAVPLPADQAQALRQWEIMQALESTGGFDAAPNLPSVLPGIARLSRAPAPLLLGAALYVGALVVMAIWLRIARARMPSTSAVLALLVVTATAAAVAAGRTGPTSTLVVHHVSKVQQIAGADAALVSTRAAAVFPSFDAFDLRALVTDGSIRLDVEGSRRQETFDDDGYPVLSGTYGLGARQVFSMEAMADVRPFEVSRQQGAVHIENTSGLELRDCRFPDDALDRPSTLAPGARVQVATLEPPPHALVTCTTPESLVTFASEGRAVLTRGTTTISLFLAPDLAP